MYRSLLQVVYGRIRRYVCIYIYAYIIHAYTLYVAFKIYKYFLTVDSRINRCRPYGYRRLTVFCYVSKQQMQSYLNYKNHFKNRATGWKVIEYKNREDQK